MAKSAHHVLFFELRKFGLLVGGENGIELGSGEGVGVLPFRADLTQAGRSRLNSGRIVRLDSCLHGLVGRVLSGSYILLRGGFGGEDSGGLLHLIGI